MLQSLSTLVQELLPTNSRDILKWLWKAAVQPVLRELAFYPQEADPLLQIWWIGVGLLAQAPTHVSAKLIKGTVKWETSFSSVATEADEIKCSLQDLHFSEHT
ncbi:hypothetical protein BGX38DRAFT_1165699 [Terfezia claveryi]|nr:hypothetical protein BGX38DRAFT_1165699 [Terfezia claveryi]